MLINDTPTPRPPRPARRPRLGRGARHLQPADRPAPGGDRLPGRRARGRRRGRLRPRARAARRAPRPPGTTPAPLGSLEGTLILNTSALTGVSIDADARRVRVGAATRWEDVDAAAVRARAGAPARLLAGRGHRRLLARRRDRLARPQARHADERRDGDRARHRRGPPRPHRRRRTSPSCSGPCAAAAATSAS